MRILEHKCGHLKLIYVKVALFLAKKTALELYSVMPSLNLLKARAGIMFAIVFSCDHN